ncbi:MAG: SpoIID/LytB domain-containing protein [Syntrophaceae bacterium]|nr:SpoIID/LytB domain-containing protein [Syntrophaceae bacterium]
MHRYIVLLGILLFLMLAGCAVQPPMVVKRAEPEIRVGLIWGADAIDFSFQKTCRIMNHDGSFIAKGLGGRRWRAEVGASISAEMVYRLVAGSFRDGNRARERSQDLRSKGLESSVRSIGDIFEINGRVINDNRTYRVYLKKAFHEKEEAEAYRDAMWNLVETFVSCEILKKAAGTIRLINLENGQIFESSKPIVFKGSPITLHEVPVGNGFHWEKSEERVYPETVRFELDNGGKLTVVNVLPIETYLLGVVPSEMSAKLHVEALKAQAVAARSELLSKLGIVHASDPFDVCADVHCQVYSGLTRRTVKSDKAIKATTGLVLFYNGHICDAVYSAVCGGHGESAQHVWGNQAPYLQGRYDCPARFNPAYGLTSETDVQQWIDDRPRVYCNTLHRHCPEGLAYTQKYFRWEVPYTQEELQSIVRRKTGRDLGWILDILPVQRGVSGRITKLAVIGSVDSVEVSGELEIRKMLSENTLWSSCFYVERRGPEGLPPTGFLIKGAGWGHGVGMCQTGAAMMALTGKKYHDILTHYYPGAQIRRIY